HYLPRPSYKYRVAIQSWRLERTKMARTKGRDRSRHSQERKRIGSGLLIRSFYRTKRRPLRILAYFSSISAAVTLWESISLRTSCLILSHLVARLAAAWVLLVDKTRSVRRASRARASTTCRWALGSSTAGASCPYSLAAFTKSFSAKSKSMSA